MFEIYKKNSMHKLKTAMQNGLVDEDVKSLLKTINNNPNFFTSSSCSGRIVLMRDPDESKIDSEFIAKWHREISFDELKTTLEKTQGNVWLRMEGFIFHISCRDINSAKRLLELKTRIGLKRGGIFHIKPDRIQVELENTPHLTIPLKHGDSQLVNDDYLKLIVAEANSRMQRNAEDL